MIRNTMFGLSLLALTAGSAVAAPVTTHHIAKVRTVAEAPMGEAAPAADKAAKPEKKAHKAKKSEKADKAPAGDAKEAPKANAGKVAPTPTEKPAETK
jgi:hypothetical protein